MLASLAPDLDGIFFFNPGLWDRFHHTFGHNIFMGLFAGTIFAIYNRSRRLELFVVCSLAAILQVFLDNITNHSSWRIMYLWPLSDYDFALGNFIEWEHLDKLLVYGIQGVLMVAIFAGTIVLYKRAGRTFLELISVRLDRFLTNFIVLHFTARCVVCDNRASFRETETNDPLCALHGKIRRDLTVERVEPEKDGQDND